jgi:hypothetical protein
VIFGVIYEAIYVVIFGEANELNDAQASTSAVDSDDLCAPRKNKTK